MVVLREGRFCQIQNGGQKAILAGCHAINKVVRYTANLRKCPQEAYLTLGWGSNLEFIDIFINDNERGTSSTPSIFKQK